MIEKELVKAAKNGLVTEVTGEQAQTLANGGYLVIAAMEKPGKIGHLATVRPSDSRYDSSEGPLLSNVGARQTSGIVSTAIGFGRKSYKNNEVKFYYDPKQTFTHDLSRIAKSQN